MIQLDKDRIRKHLNVDVRLDRVTFDRDDFHIVSHKDDHAEVLFFDNVEQGRMDVRVFYHYVGGKWKIRRTIVESGKHAREDSNP